MHGDLLTACRRRRSRGPAHLGDALHRQAVAFGGQPDRLGIGRVIDAIGLRLGRVHIAVHPVHAQLRVGGVDAVHGLAAVGIDGDGQQRGEMAFDEIAGHGFLQGRQHPAAGERHDAGGPAPGVAGPDCGRRLHRFRRRPASPGPVRAARPPAAALPTPSLASTAATWWSTVRTERCRRAAISALRRPSASARSTAASPAGEASQGGHVFAPAHRGRCRARRRGAAVPARPRRQGGPPVARRRPAPLAAARARRAPAPVASSGQPSVDHAAAASAQRTCSSSAWGWRNGPRSSGRGRPARCSRASSPVKTACRLARANASAGCTTAARAAVSPRIQQPLRRCWHTAQCAAGCRCLRPWRGPAPGPRPRRGRPAAGASAPGPARPSGARWPPRWFLGARGWRARRRPSQSP